MTIRRIISAASSLSWHYRRDIVVPKASPLATMPARRQSQAPSRKRLRLRHNTHFIDREGRAARLPPAPRLYFGLEAMIRIRERAHLDGAERDWLSARHHFSVHAGGNPTWPDRQPHSSGTRIISAREWAFRSMPMPTWNHHLCPRGTVIHRDSLGNQGERRRRRSGDERGQPGYAMRSAARRWPGPHLPDMDFARANAD